MKNVDCLALVARDDGCVISVKAVPGSSRNRIVGVLGDCLKIATSAAPEKGKANAALSLALAGALGVDRRDVELIAGLTSPRKEFLAHHLTTDQVRAILARLA